MFCINNQKNDARKFLGLTLATMMLTSLFAVTSYSGTRPRCSTVANANGVTSPVTQPQAQQLKANGKIAFVSDRDGNDEIYVMDSDGSNQTRLTNNPAKDDSPAWSPDGGRIVFMSDRNGNFEIYAMGADGSNQTRLTNNSVIDVSPDWSPDGTKIVFVQGTNSGNDIIVINADGSGQTKITEGDFYAPVWSPDGTKIAFVCFGDVFSGDICVMNATGSDLRHLTQVPVSEFDYSPSWSPDGAKILFVESFLCIFGPCASTLVVMNADGSNLQPLLSRSTIDNPGWSPDGTRITFDQSASSDKQDIFVANSSGSSPANLTNHPASDFDPAWGPLAPPAEPCPNPIDCASTFVRQQYLDFLNREPDADGLAYWTNQIIQCGSDARCIHERRIGVSAAFFVEQEFQDTGYYVDRFYKASFGRQPNYVEFTADRSKVIGGSDLEANKQAFADEWVQRQAFRDAYPNTMSNTEVVNKLFDTAGLTTSTYDSQRQQEIQALNAGHSRALVLRDVIEIPDFKNIPDPNDPRYSEVKQTSQYNSAFVLMQYFGYLHRNVDQSGYGFWLDVLNNREPNNYRGMVCSFLTSSEYQLRFGSMVTRTNADCAR